MKTQIYISLSKQMQPPIKKGCVWLSKQFEEAPNADSAEHRDRQVVVPSEEVGHFAGRGDKSRPDAHDAEGHGAGDGRHAVRDADSLG